MGLPSLSPWKICIAAPCRRSNRPAPLSPEVISHRLAAPEMRVVADGIGLGPVQTLIVHSEDQDNSSLAADSDELVHHIRSPPALKQCSFSTLKPNFTGAS